MSESLTIRSRDDLALEAALDGPAEPQAALVLCHPHPKMGGTMEAPLLIAVTEAMTQAGWAVLRFNFRGIGASEGEPSTGEAEVADALGAIDHVREGLPGIPVALAGWSFGAAVAVRALAADDDVVACAAIAPAVNPKEGVTAGLPDAVGLKGRAPVLLVCGKNDHLVAPDDCSSWAAAAGARVEIMTGANHFFWGKYDDLAETVRDWLEDAVGRGKG